MSEEWNFLQKNLKLKRFDMLFTIKRLNLFVNTSPLQ